MHWTKYVLSKLFTEYFFEIFHQTDVTRKSQDCWKQ